MIPRRLPEGSEGNRVSLNGVAIGFLRLTDVAEKLRRKQSGRKFLRPEGANSTQDFAAIKSCHPDRGDLARLFVQVQIWSEAHANASIGEVDRAFSVMRKVAEE